MHRQFIHAFVVLVLYTVYSKGTKLCLILVGRDISEHQRCDIKH